jgi:hypothetical protein
MAVPRWQINGETDPVAGAEFRRVGHDPDGDPAGLGGVGGAGAVRGRGVGPPVEALAPVWRKP